MIGMGAGAGAGAATGIGMGVGDGAGTVRGIGAGAGAGDVDGADSDLVVSFSSGIVSGCGFSAAFGAALAVAAAPPLLCVQTSL